MFPKRRIAFLLGIGMVGCGIFAVILWIQLDRGKELATTAMPSSTLQVPPKLRKTIELPLTKTIGVSQQEKQTVDNQSKDLESVPTVTDVPDTVVPLDEEEETLSALVDSLSVEDLEELDGLTVRDFLSEEEQEELDRHVLRHLEEFTEITPKIVNLREKIIALRMEVEQLGLNLDNPRDKGVWDKYVEDTRNMREELIALEERLPTLEGVLINDELDGVYQIDKEKIRRIVKEILDGKGYPWYQP